MATRVPVVYGAMTFGLEGSTNRRVASDEEAQAILDTLKAHNVNEVDTSRFYTDGTSEVVLGNLDAVGQGFKIATKCYPTGSAMIKSKEGLPTYTHTEESIRAAIKASFEALRVESVPLWYLHGPDRKTPWAETFEATDKLFKEGKFERLGISNYKASEVEEILSLCDEKGWVKPSVYQGPYNVIQRQIGPELIPVMRKWGMSLIAFNPLLGGFLTSLKTADSESEPGSRFDPAGGVGKMYRGRYWKDEYFAASAKLDEAAKLASTTMPALVLRWVEHHSVLDPALGDRILIGASNHTQLDANLMGLEGGPLDAPVLALIEEAAAFVKDCSPPYHH